MKDMSRLGNTGLVAGSVNSGINIATGPHSGNSATRSSSRKECLRVSMVTGRVTGSLLTEGLARLFFALV